MLLELEWIQFSDGETESRGDKVTCLPSHTAGRWPVRDEDQPHALAPAPLSPLFRILGFTFQLLMFPYPLQACHSRTLDSLLALPPYSPRPPWPQALYLSLVLQASCSWVLSPGSPCGFFWWSQQLPLIIASSPSGCLPQDYSSSPEPAVQSGGVEGGGRREEEEGEGGAEAEGNQSVK